MSLTYEVNKYRVGVFLKLLLYIYIHGTMMKRTVDGRKITKDAIVVTQE